MEHDSLREIRNIEYPCLGTRPVEIVRSRLYQNRETWQMVLYLHLRNIHGKAVSSVCVDICCFDENVNLIETRQQTYTAEDIENKEHFGEEIPLVLSSLRTCSVTATVASVTFEDGSAWTRPQEEVAEDALRLHEQKNLSFMRAERRMKKQRKRRWIAAVLIVVLLSGAIAGGAAYMRRTDQEITAFAHQLAAGELDAAKETKAWLDGRLVLFENKVDADFLSALLATQEEDYREAARLFAAHPKHAESVLALRQMNQLLSGAVSAGEYHSVALRKNGTVAFAGDNSFGQGEIGHWQHVVAVAAGARHTLGLSKDGHVYAAGAEENTAIQTEGWENMVAIAAGESHSVAVKNNGRVVAAGDNTYGQCKVENWAGVVSVACGKNHTVALCEDGTVLATGDNPNGCCNVEKWTDVVAIAAGDAITVGIDKNHRLLIAGMEGTEIDGKGIFAACGDKHGLFLDEDLTLQGFGDDTHHQARVSQWENVLCADGGKGHTVAVLKDGSAVAIGDSSLSQCRVEEWTNIGIPKGALERTSIPIFIKEAHQFVK